MTVELVPGPQWSGQRAAARLRTRVFVEGQGVSAEVEADRLDASPATTHAVLHTGGDVVATGRLVDPGGPVAVGRIGRMAVDPAARGRGHGRTVLRALEQAARGRGLVGIDLAAQLHARAFYASAGYDPDGEVFLEQGIEHVAMSSSWLPGLRPVRAGEADAVQDLIGGCFAEYDGCVLDLPGLDAWMREPSSRPLWVLPGVTGLDACVCVGGGTELKSLYVRRAARGRGTGAALVRLAERAGAVELWSDSRFLDAHRLYERLGWSSTGRTRSLHDPSRTTELRFVRV